MHPSCGALQQLLRRCGACHRARPTQPADSAAQQSGARVPSEQPASDDALHSAAHLAEPVGSAPPAAPRAVRTRLGLVEHPGSGARMRCVVGGTVVHTTVNIAWDHCSDVNTVNMITVLAMSFET